MLKILAGLDDATSGHVHIGDREVTDLAPGARDIAMVFQNYALYPHLSVRNNMAFGLRMRGLPRADIDRRVGEAARILGLEALLDRKPRALSGGQRQRVALGRAIVREPAAFLMDEPLSNLDAKLRGAMRAEIGALHQRLGTTTLYVTHDQIEAMTMADRIVIMRDGRIQQIADPDTMFARPSNLFVAGFIGAPAMNFMKTTARGEPIPSARLFGLDLPIASHIARPELIAGLRPERFMLGAGGPATIGVRPILVESLGAEKYIHFEPPAENRIAAEALTWAEEDRRGARLIARLVDPGPVAVGEEVMLSFNPRHIQYFDPASEQALEP
jgi:multiple sugar transport system ATP-binding protein